MLANMPPRKLHSSLVNSRRSSEAFAIATHDISPFVGAGRKRPPDRYVGIECAENAPRSSLTDDAGLGILKNFSKGSAASG